MHGETVKFVENSTKLTCLGTTGYQIKYSRVLWLLDLQIRHGRKVRRRFILSTVTPEIQTANVAYVKKKTCILG